MKIALELYWHDNHNEDYIGVYEDSLYNGPIDYKCYTTDDAGIAMWGELGTADSPDDEESPKRATITKRRKYCLINT